MPPGAAGLLETLLVPGASWRKGHLGAEEKGRHKKKAREGMCQEGPVSELAGAGGGSLPKGPNGARQQGALMRKPGKGSVISGVPPFSISGPSLRLLRNRVLWRSPRQWAPAGSRLTRGMVVLQGLCGIFSLYSQPKVEGSRGSPHSSHCREGTREKKNGLEREKTLLEVTQHFPPHAQPGPGFGKWSPRTRSCK